MSTRVIQGFFVGGTMRAAPGVALPAAPARPLQARTAPGAPIRPAGPPQPAFASAARVAQPHGGNGDIEVDATRLGLVRNGGKPLPDPLLAKMEAAFDADFSAVRVHVGPQAARIGAIAFTTGNDLYFAPGRYQPDSVQGQQLIGHELTHVIQQRQGRVRAAAGGGVSVVQDRALEAEADRLGVRAANYRAPVQAQTLQRQAAPAPPTVRFRPPAHGPAQFVQPMEDTIGSRVGNRRKLGRTKSARLRGNIAYRGAPVYYERRETGIWNGKTRPRFVESTWRKLWKRCGSITDGNGDRLYQCENCNTWCLRKVDAPNQARALDATIDHVINWKQYIYDNGAPDYRGKITTQGALIAYNDKDNLVPMCRSCNAAKNGPRNVFD